MRSRRHAGVGAVLAVATAPLLAQAEPTPEERAVAATLFAEGRRLLDEGRVSEACARLAESQRLDPGGGTVLNLALCRKLEGRAATAQALFTEALAVARRDGRADRVEVCQRELTELAAVVATLVIEVPEDARAPGLLVRLNGVVIPELAWAVPIPVDPGAARIDVTAPGRAPQSLSVPVRPAGRAEIRLTPLEALPAPTSGPPPRAAAPRPAPSREEPRSGGGSGLLGLSRLDVDGKLRGATLFVGPGVTIVKPLELAAGALLGGTLGAEAELRVLPWPGRVRPLLEAAAPLFFDDGAYVGGRVGVGLEVQVIGALCFAATAGGAFFPSAPEGQDPVVFLPGVGVVLRP